MTKTKHTPGPWYISEVENGYAFISANEHVRLARVVWQIEDDEVCGECSPSCEANAHLIAAAPELLEEHKEWASLIGRVYLMIRQGRSEEAADLIVEAEVIDYQSGEPVAVSDAITKAEGGE